MAHITRTMVREQTTSTKQLHSYSYSCNINGMQFHGSESINYSNALLDEKGNYTCIGDFKNKLKFVDDVYKYLNNIDDE